MKRSIILTENERPIFRSDFVTKNGQDDLENEVALFIMHLERSKNMIESTKVIQKLQQMKHTSLDTILNFFCDASNVDIFVAELNNEVQNIKTDLRIRFNRKNIRANLVEALKI